MLAPIDQNTGNNGQQETANPILAHPGLRALLQQQIAIRDGSPPAGTPSSALMPAAGSSQGPMAPAISLPAPTQPTLPHENPTVSEESPNQAHLNELRSKPPALENVYGKITGSDWGQNHPGLGKLLGIAGQIPATAADLAMSLKGLPVLGDSLSSIGRVMPGTTEQHNAQLTQAQGAVDAEAANAEKGAQTQNLKSKPEIAQTRNSLAQEKQDEVENNHLAQIDQHLRTTGYKRDETGNIVPDEQSPAYQKQQIANQLAQSTVELRNAQTAFEQMKGDPNSVPNQQIAQRLQIAKQTQDRMTGMMGAMQERADAQMINAKAGAYGVGMDNQPLPGAMLTEGGQPVGSHFQANVRPTGAQRTKGNMAESADQQINDMKSIVAKRPDVFGPAAGRVTDFNVWLGSQDPDAQRFRAARTIAGDHLAGTFGGRSETALKELDSAIGHFKDNPQAVTAGLNQLQEANHKFLEAGKVHTVGGQGNQPAQGGGAPIGTTTQPDGVYEKDGKHFRAQGGKVYAQ